MSKNPHARIRITADCPCKGDCPEKPSAQGDGDVCWSLDSRKTVHSSPPDFSGSWPSFPLVSIYLDVLPREWGPHSVPVCLLGNLGYLRQRVQGCAKPNAGWVPSACSGRPTGSYSLDSSGKGEVKGASPLGEETFHCLKPVLLQSAPPPNQSTDEGGGMGRGRMQDAGSQQEELTQGDPIRPLPSHLPGRHH